MVFSSPAFLFLFLPVVITGYWACPGRLRNAWLLLASILFYAWGEGFFALIMLVSIAVNWGAALLVERSRTGTPRKLVLAVAVAVNLGMLVFWKYANFAVDTVNPLLSALGVAPVVLSPLHLPAGISFFTFHALSYVVDVYRGISPAQPKFSRTALYISLFPQLVAGPIIRYHDIVDQLNDRMMKGDWIAGGLMRFVLGLGKKILIANTTGAVADKVFALPPHELSLPLAWLGIVCYTLQIYYDFSGYSDMAIGIGRIFGFHFLENFNYPYAARSIREFWQKWHISLSNWFRDYFYIPLGGNRGGAWSTYRNLLLVFALCGFWHGASWAFLFWGLWHGLFLVIERTGAGRALDRLPRPLQHLYTLLVVMAGWVLFRVDTISHAAFYLQTLAGMGLVTSEIHPMAAWIDGRLIAALLLGCLCSAPVFPWATDRMRELLDSGNSGAPRGGPVIARMGLVLGTSVFLLSVAAMAAGTYNPFIYFRF